MCRLTLINFGCCPKYIFEIYFRTFTIFKDPKSPIIENLSTWIILKFEKCTFIFPLPGSSHKNHLSTEGDKCSITTRWKDTTTCVTSAFPCFLFAQDRALGISTCTLSGDYVRARLQVSVNIVVHWNKLHLTVVGVLELIQKRIIDSGSSLMAGMFFKTLALIACHPLMETARRHTNAVSWT